MPILGSSLSTCGTYATDPLEYIDPLMSLVSPRIEYNKDDLPEPTCKHIVQYQR